MFDTWDDSCMVHKSNKFLMGKEKGSKKKKTCELGGSVQSNDNDKLLNGGNLP